MVPCSDAFIYHGTPKLIGLIDVSSQQNSNVEEKSEVKLEILKKNLVNPTLDLHIKQQVKKVNIIDEFGGFMIVRTKIHHGRRGIGMIDYMKLIYKIFNISGGASREQH